MNTRPVAGPLLLVALLGALLGSTLLLPPGPAAAQPAASSVVISQVYGGGGNSGAPFTHDFVELHNRSSAPVSLEGWSLQYASASGTGNFGANESQLTPLSGSIAPGRYLLVQEASGAAGISLPPPDVTDPSPINLSATAGKVALVRSPTSLGCNGGSATCSPAALAQIADLVGYGGANFFEGAGPAPAGSNTTALLRAGNGTVDTDDNAADFATGAPNPRPSCFPDSCPTATPTPLVSATATATATATGTGAGGTPTSTPTPSPTVPAVAARIREVQGAAHRSPLTGSPVTGVPGIVIARRSNGFYIQDPQPDSSEPTSEGVFVFTDSLPTVAIGDDVRVDGQVQEFRPGCTPTCSPSSSEFDNLTITQIATGGGAGAVRVVSSGNPTPTPVVLGAGGRLPPTQVISDDSPGDVEAGGLFDPESDGIDFYESLEGMLVQVNNAVATGPRRSTGEIPVVGDNGDGASQRTTRGGVVVRAGDFNPERIFLDDLFTTTPNVDVADRFPGAITGVMDYSFGNYKLQALVLPPLLPAALPRETAVPAAPDELAVATFNVENLDAADPSPRFAGLASLIVNGLQSPDILALEEVQDDNGPTNDGTVVATQTYNLLIQAIKDAGGPTYEVRQVNPLNNQDGGEPGGNIRVALLFRFDRGLCFVDRPGAGSDTATIPVLGPDGLQLTFSPGRIDPTNSAWSNSRKPLAGEFRYNGQTLFVIANHFNSKGGDDPLFGRFQPPVLNTEAQRRAQAQVERDFISALLALDPQARVVALGDLNDFEFSPPLSILEGSDMTALVETLPPGERYTYVFDGNSQALDHTLVSRSLLAQLVAYDIIHVNAEYVQQESDHDPQVTRFRLGGTPTPAGVPSCGAQQGTPSPTPTAGTATATPTGTFTASPTVTATATPTPTAALTATVTPTATATATPSPTPLPTPTSSAGRVSVVGAGLVDAQDGSASFALSARQRPGDSASGALLYRSLQRGLTVRSESITTLEVTGNQATITGTCTDLTRDTPCTFRAVAIEGERPGRGGSFSVQVDGAGPEGGPVRAGVVRIND